MAFWNRAKEPEPGRNDLSFDPETLRAEVETIQWWHPIDLRRDCHAGYRRDAGQLAEIRMPQDLSGRSVLDIGAWDWVLLVRG